MNAGWIRSESDARLTGTTGVFDPLVLPINNLQPRQFGYSGDGFLAGLTLGYNQKMGVAFVGGIEADIAYTDIDNGATGVNPPVLGFVAPTTISTELDWFGTVRARAGWLASQQILLYATGGLAYANIELSASESLTAVGLLGTGSSSDWKAGWTVAGGMEWLLGNKTTLKGEYLYYDLNDSSVTIVSVGAPGTATYNVENKGHIVRVGLNVALY